jgi:hypothetical protein
MDVSLRIRERISSLCAKGCIIYWKYAEVGAGAFFALSRFCTRERKAKKRARKREERKARKKVKAPSTKEKKCEFALFAPPKWKSGFRAHSRGQAEEDRQSGLGSTGYVEQDWNYRTGRKGQAGQDRQDRIAQTRFDSQKRTRQQENNSQNGT